MITKEAKTKFIKMLEQNIEAGNHKGSLFDSIKTVMRNYKKPKQIKELGSGANQLSDLMATKEYGLAVRKTPKLFAPGTAIKNQLGKDIDVAEIENEIIADMHKRNSNAMSIASKLEPNSFAAVYKKPNILDDVSISYNEYISGEKPDIVPDHIKKSVRSIMEKNPNIKISDITPDNIINGKVIDAEFFNDLHKTRIVPHPNINKGTKKRERDELLKHIIYTKKHAYGS